jgi:hypothetical protein
MSQNQLTRICAACGIQKPLSAFLQLSGKASNSYGNICATCRSQGKTAPDSTDDTGSTGRTVEHRIGTKEKVFAETENKKQIKDLKEFYRQEVNKKEELLDKKTKQTDIIEQERKDHRINYIEAKQKTFLDNKREKIDASIERTLAEREKTLEAIKQEDLVRRELQIARWDMPGGFVDPQAALSKYKEGAFLQFKTWLGKSAHLSTTERIYNAKPDTPNAKKTATDKKEKAHKEPSIDEYLDKRAGPSARKR